MVNFSIYRLALPIYRLTKFLPIYRLRFPISILKMSIYRLAIHRTPSSLPLLATSFFFSGPCPLEGQRAMVMGCCHFRRVIDDGHGEWVNSTSSTLNGLAPPHTTIYRALTGKGVRVGVPVMII